MAGRKGYIVEEVLRSFFLRRGFFVVRSVPVVYGSSALTDVDIWLYGKSTGGSRQLLICDSKAKNRPKAIERMLWTTGLMHFLKADGAYVSTTDKRQEIRGIASRLSLQLIDGNDIQRIRKDRSIAYKERLSDEELSEQLAARDESIGDRFLRDTKDAILSSLTDGFGARSACRALELFGKAALRASSVPPNSDCARVASRLAYLAAAIACVSLDYVSREAVVQAPEDRRRRLLETVRLGRLRDEVGQQALEMALLLVSKYGPGGRSAARAVELKLNDELDQIPAEIVADTVAGIVRQGDLFAVARDLEMSSYRREVPTFDDMRLNVRAVLGAFLDYSGIQREMFCGALAERDAAACDVREPTQRELFGED